MRPLRRKYAGCQLSVDAAANTSDNTVIEIKGASAVSTGIKIQFPTEGVKDIGIYTGGGENPNPVEVIETARFLPEAEAVTEWMVRLQRTPIP